jgi:hypothetical protein
MGQGIGSAEIGQLEAGIAILAQRPAEAVRPQRIGRSGQVDQVEARISARPLALVGIDEVAPEQVARDFIVEAHAVVAERAGLRLAASASTRCGEIRARRDRAQSRLGADAGDRDKPPVPAGSRG